MEAGAEERQKMAVEWEIAKANFYFEIGIAGSVTQHMGLGRKTLGSSKGYLVVL